jgi:hypothetical protein
MAYTNLENYYRLNFSLQQIHKWPINMIENMTPFDREIYTQLLVQHIEDAKNKQPNN